MEQAPLLTLPPGGAQPDLCGWLRASDGVQLRAAIWRPDEAKAVAILLNGRTEFIEKMAIPAAELMSRGYAVASLDWRGQGLSDRLTDNPAKGHVGDFAEYQTDLDALLGSPEVQNLKGPRILMAHSMGGAIGTAALSRAVMAGYFSTVVFSAPMLGIAMNPPMRAAAWATLKIGKALGKEQAWPPFGDNATTYALTDPPENVLTHDDAVWDWMAELARTNPEVTIGMPTLGWFAAADAEMKRLSETRNLGCPALYLVGTEEAVVVPAKVADAAKRTASRLAIIQGGRHEVLVEKAEIRAAAWAEIDRHLAEQGLPSG